ncbi:hypothetical protein J6590_079132 [Homalodisca vitripennis]|nr:hypothetical protein J6590_079132 [Homalodisca vitripennis]
MLEDLYGSSGTPSKQQHDPVGAGLGVFGYERSPTLKRPGRALPYGEKWKRKTLVRREGTQGRQFKGLGRNWGNGLVGVGSLTSPGRGMENVAACTQRRILVREQAAFFDAINELKALNPTPKNLLTPLTIALHPSLCVAWLCTEAYSKSPTIESAVNGFRATGVWTVDRLVCKDCDFAAAGNLILPNDSNKQSSLCKMQHQIKTKTL